MLKIVFILLPLFAFSINSEITNAEEVNYAQPAWYISVAGSWDIHLFESTAEDVSEGLVDLDDAWGLDVKIGRRMYKWLSIELEYEYINGFDFSVVGVEVLKVQANTLTGNLKFHYPLKRFIPYISGGIGGTWYRLEDQTGIGVDFESDTVFAGRTAAGFDLFINENWAFNANYSIVLTTFDLTNPTQIENISDVHYGSLQFGLAYYF